METENGLALGLEIHLHTIWSNRLSFLFPNDCISKEYYDQYGYGDQFGREMVEGRDFEKRPAGGFYFYRAWDLEKMYYREWTPQQNHNLSVTGGTDKVKYSMSAGLVSQKGILKLFDDTYMKKNFSGNLSVDVNKYITLRSVFSIQRLTRNSIQLHRIHL